MFTTETDRTQDKTPRPALIDVLRQELRVYRAELAARRQLQKDLATYTRPAEIADLEATLDRYDESDVAEIRRILDRNRAA